MQIEGYLRLLSCHPVGTEDHQDITDDLTAVQVIGHVQPLDPKAPDEEAATQRPSTTESPSMSTAPTGHLPVATPRVVLTLDPFPPTPPPSLSPTIPPCIPHPCLRSDIRSPTPQSFPKLSPIPSFDLGIGPTPPEHEPPSHSTPSGPSSGIDPPPVQAEQAVVLLAPPEGRPKRISKAHPCGIGGTNMDTKLGPRHLTKDMQDLLLII